MEPVTMLLTALTMIATKAGDKALDEGLDALYQKVKDKIFKKTKEDHEFAEDWALFARNPQKFKPIIKEGIVKHQLAQDEELIHLVKDILDRIGPDPTAAFQQYLEHLVRECQYISLQGLDVQSSDAHRDKKRIELSNVYIDLNTTEPKKKNPSADESREVYSVLESVAAYDKVLLLGDPGSGKSTFVNHLSLTLAMHRLNPDQPVSKELPSDIKDLVPVKIILRDFVRYMAKFGDPAKPKCMMAFISKYLEENMLLDAKGKIAEFLENSALVMFDGLDEIGDVRLRNDVQTAIQSFISRYPTSRYIVTCRIRSYEQHGWRVEGFKPFTLAPFHSDQIRIFIKFWYHELEQQKQLDPGEAENLITKLTDAVNRPDIAELAPNPLLLTIMTLVHAHLGELPDARVLLYKETIEILMYRWDGLKIRGDEKNVTLLQLLQQAGRNKVDLEMIFHKLAFNAKCDQNNGEADLLVDITAHDLQCSLAGLKKTDDGKPDLNWAQDIVETLKLRAGLLIERAPGIFTFPHRTFQEYLAAVHLAGQPDFVKQAFQLTDNISYWREVLLLAVGIKVYDYKQYSDILHLVAECQSEQNIKDTEGWRRIALAGEMLKEMKTNRAEDSELGRQLLTRSKTLHVELITENRLQAQERAQAGVILANIGDPRDEIMTLDNLPFCWVPGGDFYMGEDDEQHLNKTLQHDFWIAQFPVSNAQFAVFVKENGYKQAEFWREAQDAKWWNPDGFKGKFDNKRRTGPVQYGMLFDLANHPVVGVSWYEALAFCRWLDARMQPQIKPWRIRLISEAEWEKAARGGVEIPEQPQIHALANVPFKNKFQICKNDHSKRKYPWSGDEALPEKANYDKTGINSTSALGCFSNEQSPVGAQEMSGNVWEWTRSLWGKDFSKPDFNYPYKPEKCEKLDAGSDVMRVLRGGSYYDNAEGLRCALRVRYDPDSGPGATVFESCCLPLDL